MKKIALIILGFFLGALAMYFYCTNDTSSVFETYDTPKGLITPAQAKALDQEFNSRHALISDSIVKRPDNRSSWYSIKDMKDYLSYAETEAKGLGYTLDGIRVYLGAYPETNGDVGYTTMFFIPTGVKNTSQGSFINFNLQKGGDIPGGNGLNAGDPGDPPNANYPQ